MTKLQSLLDSMDEYKKDQTQIEIRPPPFLPGVSCELTFDELLVEQKISYFKPLSKRRGENMCAIASFVLIHFVAFVATMLFNDCWHKSHGDCALKTLGIVSFQPLGENPFLGPSASTLSTLGALQRTNFTKDHQMWQLFISPWLHAGVIHLVINLSSVIFIGVRLEQEFGPLRIGIIYICSGFTGGLVALLFLQDRPSVTSSGALFGLLGAMISGIIRNWKYYTKKLAALLVFFLTLTINGLLGLPPYINNFSNIGGFISGLLLGFTLFFSPQLGKMAQNKKGLFDYGSQYPSTLTLRLDKPVLRSVSLTVLALLIGGIVIAVVHGKNMNTYCTWCPYIDCVPFHWWTCNDKEMLCESLRSKDHLTMTCTDNGKFRVFPFTDVKQERIQDLCNLICSYRD